MGQNPTSGFKFAPLLTHGTQIAFAVMKTQIESAVSRHPTTTLK